MRTKYLLILFFITATTITAWSQSDDPFEGIQMTIEDASIINTPSSDFGPAIIGDKLFFNSFSAEDADKGKNNDKTFYELFSADIDNLGNILTNRSKVNDLVTEYHEGPLSYCEETKQLFLTQSNWENPEELNTVFKKENIRLGLVIYEQTSSGWELVENFPYNSNQYSIAHPAINKTGDTLVFVSDMPGSLGETDLFYSVKRNGSWSEPVNMGNQINTPQREMFPFITDEGTLIFSSDGHGGAGNLDLFYTKFSPSENEEVKTFTGDMNSTEDDFGLIIDSDMRFGYFASNREGGVGDDDIYYVKLQQYRLDLLAISNYSSEPLPETQISIYNLDGDLITQGATDADGILPVKLDVGDRYRVVANIEGYVETNQLLNLSDEGEFVDREERVYMEPAYVLKGEVVDILGNTPIPESMIAIQEDGVVMDTLFTDVEGNFTAYVEPDHDYYVDVSARNYFGTDVTITTDGIQPGEIDYYFQLYSLDAGSRIELKNIYYDLDKYDIRPDAARELDRLVAVLNEYPDIEIKLESHTDSRGSDEYNMELSEKRAQAAVDYLVSKGIDPDRLESVGLGETQLVNDCGNGVDCTEEQHQENRRTVVEIMKAKVTKRQGGSIFYF